MRLDSKLKKSAATLVRELYKCITYFWCVTVVRMLLVKSYETKKQITKSVTNVRELYKYTTYFWCVTVVRLLLVLVKSYETKK